MMRGDSSDSLLFSPATFKRNQSISCSKIPSIKSTKVNTARELCVSSSLKY